MYARQQIKQEPMHGLPGGRHIVVDNIFDIYQYIRCTAYQVGAGYIRKQNIKNLGKPNSL